jgi:hypothetical protein
MFIKTNIPETTRSLVGACVDFGDRMFDASSVKHQINQIQVIVSGNRCGHVPDEPRFFNRPDHHKRRPSVLENAIEKLKDVYRRPKKFFKKLATFHPHDRQVRSERREAIASVFQVLLHYLDLSTLRVGFWADNKFVPLDLVYIAKKASIGLLRARRAISDLVQAGYIKTSRQFDKKEDGSFAGLPAIREISVQAFIDLGADMQKLFFSREWKRKEQEKAVAKKSYKKLSGIIKAVTSFGGRIISSNKRHHQLSTEEAKALTSRALELHRLNPEKSPSEYFIELRRQKE